MSLLSRTLIFLYFQKGEDQYIKLSRFGMCIGDLTSKISKRVVYFLKESEPRCPYTGCTVCSGPWDQAHVLLLKPLNIWVEYSPVSTFMYLDVFPSLPQELGSFFQPHVPCRGDFKPPSPVQKRTADILESHGQ